MKRLAFIAFCLFSFLHSQAQKTEYAFGFRITSLQKKDAIYSALLNGGEAIGVKINSEGSVYGTRRANLVNHNKKLGTAVVKETSENQSRIEISLTEPEEILIGDLVYINIEVNNQWHSSYFYAASNAIEIVDDNLEPYYSLNEVLIKDGHGLRTEKFLHMLRDIRLTAERLKKSKDKTLVEAGPHHGKLVSEVMELADTSDVWDYVYYLNQFVFENMGQTIKLSDGFYSYIKEGDVINSAVLKDLFVNVNDEKRKVNFENYKRKINTDIVKDWLKDANSLIDEKKYDEGIALLEANVFLSDQIKEAEQGGLTAFRIGEVHDYFKQYDKSIEWFAKAAQEFEAAKHEEYLAHAKHYLGKDYYNLKEYNRAIEAYGSSVAIWRKLGGENPTSTAVNLQLFKILDDDGNALLANGDLDQAVTIYNEGLTASKKTGDKADEASALWSLGYAYSKKNDGLSNAVKYYDASAAIYVQLNDSTNAATQFENSGKFYKSLEQFSTALDRYQKRLTYLRPNETSKLGDAYWDVAYTFSRLKDYKKSNETYRVAEKYFLKDTSGRCSIINNIGYNYRDINDSISAYKMHNEAIALATQWKNSENLADVYFRTSDSYNHFKNYHKRIAYLKLQQQYLEKIGQAGKVAECLERQGDAESSLQKYQAAITAFQQAADEYNKVGNKSEVAECLEKQGDNYVFLEKYEIARSTFLQAAEAYKMAGNTNKEAEMHWDCGYNWAKGATINYDESIREYEEAYKMYMQQGDSVNASTMLSNIGQNNWSKSDYPKAIEYHRAAINLATKCKNIKRVAESWSKLTKLYTESNNPIASAEALSNATAALEKIGDSTDLAKNYVDLADNYSKSKQYEKATEFYSKAMAVQKIRKDSIGYASTLSSLGGMFQNKREFKEASKYYDQAYVIQKRLKDDYNLIYTLANRGVIAQSVDNDYAAAERYFNEAIKLSVELKDSYMQGFTYSRMKFLYRAQGKKEMAESVLKKMQEVYWQAKLWKDYGLSLCEAANDASYVDGDNKRAMTYLDKAQALNDTLKDTGLQASIYGVRNLVLREMAEFSQSLDYANKSLQLYRQVDNSWGVAGAYIDKGNIFKQINEYDSAIHCQSMADSIYKKLNSEYARLAPLANLGECMTSEGNYDMGLEYYKKSYAIMQKAHDYNENLGIVQACIGESYLYLHQYAESEKWLKESLVTCDKVGALRVKADNLHVIGRLKIEVKKYDEAFQYLSEGLKISKEKSIRIAYINNLMLMGKLETERKNYSAARPWLDECIKFSRETGKNSTLWESLYWLGVLYKNTKQLDESKKYLKESVEVIEKIRNKVSGGEEARKLFSSDENILKAYEALVDVLLQLGETDLAMSYIQKNNEDNLKAKFKNLDVKFENKEKEKAVVLERNMKAKLDGIEQQLTNEKSLPIEKQNIEKIRNLEGIKTVAETDYLKFVNLQVNVRPELTKYFNNSVQPVNFKNEKKYIPKDMALLSYLPGESQLYIFIATRDTVIAKVVEIGREKLNRDINAILNIARNSMGTFPAITLNTEETERKELVAEVKQTDKMLRPFEEMYHYLIAPASAEISSKKRLGIIPTGVLNYIPFQMLGKTLSNGKFSLLINQFSIFYVNSTRILSQPTRSEKNYKIIAFGNPDKTLPSTEIEVDDIKKIYPTASIYLREQATEDKAKYAPEEFNVMHFATHGNLDYEDFTQSFLTMANNPEKKEDGKLTLEELWGMNVMNHLDIVVLSACQTAVTKGSNENSPVSPASGFLQNGVNSVVATLWKVDDEATTILITDFYKNIKTMDAVDAIRLAQVNLSKNPKFTHPYYWAAEILMGDWR